MFEVDVWSLKERVRERRGEGEGREGWEKRKTKRASHTLLDLLLNILGEERPAATLTQTFHKLT